MILEGKTLSFEDAKRQYVHRFTMEHVPAWSQEQRHDGSYYAPNYRTDLEWYKATSFPPYQDFPRDTYCQSQGQTWPLGTRLDKPYKVQGGAK